MFKGSIGTMSRSGIPTEYIRIYDVNRGLVKIYELKTVNFLSVLFNDAVNFWDYTALVIDE
jgi:hypothetical protein